MKPLTIPTKFQDMTTRRNRADEKMLII